MIYIVYICAEQLKTTKMIATITNNGTAIVNLFNSTRLVDRKYFDTEKQAVIFCKKFNYEVVSKIDDSINCENIFNY